MKKSPRQQLVSEVIGRMGDLIRERELAVDADQYETITKWIVEEFERITPQTPLMFDARRKPWIRIMEQLLLSIERQELPLDAFAFLDDNGLPALQFSPAKVMHHLKRTRWMLERWEDMPIRSSTALKKHLVEAGVLLLDVDGRPRAVDASAGVVAVNLGVLRRSGIDAFKSQMAARARGQG